MTPKIAKEKPYERNFFEKLEVFFGKIRRKLFNQTFLLLLRVIFSFQKTF